MLEFEGKHNKAVFMGDEIDEATTTQLYTFLNHPAFAGTKIVIMPDAHAGAGVCIGFTMTMNEMIIPSVVGVDVGCSVEAFNLGKRKKWKKHRLERLDKFVHENIPSGHSVNEIPFPISKELKEKIEAICAKLEIDPAYALKSIGSLGSGNHFIAIESDVGADWLVIHSGSRNFGLQIANFHQAKARALMKEEFKGAAAYRGLEYLQDENAEAYLTDMRVAQEFATQNRATMARVILEEHFGLGFDDVERVISVHNYINFEDRIIRKGAISAHKGERVIIPLNMRDGSILGVGKGNENWNFSAPHGAGRKMSRRQAREKIDLSTYRSQMTQAGVFSTCISKKTLDEAPDAYKKSSVILDGISESVEIQSNIKPVYNFKGI